MKLHFVPLFAAILIIILTSQASAYSDDDCKPPKTSFSETLCTTDANIFVGMDKDYQPQTLLNKQGKVIASLKGFDQVGTWELSEGLLPVSKNGKIGYLNTQGKLVVPTVYDSVGDEDNKYDESWANLVDSGRITVKKNGKFGVIDTNNKTIVPFNKYAKIDGFFDGRAVVFSAKSQKYGVINTSGKEVVAPIYDNVYGTLGGNEGYSEGLAGVLKGKNWGFVNGAHKVVIPFRYADDNVQRLGVNYLGATYFVFDKGVAEVSTKNGEPVCINKSGKTVACR
ncbi:MULTISPECIES: WG repeat-containing protein [Psychrobacter]|uniref:WG repeat-containing protein n=1 Tax=Psychrobacter TaxID=497 RepID=UPI00146F681E|nr:MULTISPECIES: WG repeat-containing protein [Psychrobacter]